MRICVSVRLVMMVLLVLAGAPVGLVAAERGADVAAAGEVGADVAAAGEVGADAGASLAQLQWIQERVQRWYPKLNRSVVVLRSGDGTATGVVVSEDGLIMTAAHVTSKPGVKMAVVLPDGTFARATALGLDPTTDAGLAQLNDRETKWPFVRIQRYAGAVRPGQWCFALGHPGGWDAGRGVVLRVGRVLKVTANSLQTDCVLMGGDSGGPLFDVQGRLIGIHSQIWEGRQQNMHVSMAPFMRSWEAMKGSAVIQTWGTGSGGYLGLVPVSAEPFGVLVEDLVPESPAALAGLLAGDTVLRVGREEVQDDLHFAALIRARAPGERLRLQVKAAGGELRRVEVVLGQRPGEGVTE